MTQVTESRVTKDDLKAEIREAWDKLRTVRQHDEFSLADEIRNSFLLLAADEPHDACCAWTSCAWTS